MQAAREGNSMGERVVGGGLQIRVEGGAGVVIFKFDDSC